MTECSRGRQRRQNQEKVRQYAKEFAKELHVCGLMNMQLAVKDGELYMIEVNPRASRTVPFVSKSIGVPLASYASRCMLGETLEQIGFTEEVHVPYVSVKEAVFPFVKFPGVDITLSPKMKAAKRGKRKYARIVSFDEREDCT